MLALLLLAHAAKGQLDAVSVAGEECGGDPFCGGNGQCWEGACRCSRGFSGAVCSMIVGCPNECMGHGTCARAGLDGAQRACRCLSGWSGLACDSQRCPDDCSGRGRCTAGVCACAEGYSGASCTVGSCRPACVHGECGADFSCKCQPGWTSVACDTPLPCAAPAAASAPATSTAAAAASAPGAAPAAAPRHSLDWIAPQPLTPQPLAPHEANPCGQHGECLRGLCFCEVDWFGVDCAKRRCRVDDDPTAGAEPACHAHGACVDGACECADGWLAPDCGSRRCPNDCSGWCGYCLAPHGVCSCKPGYSGADCSAAAAGAGHLVEDPTSEAAALSAPPRAAGAAGAAGGARAQQADPAAQRVPSTVPWDDGAHNGIPQGLRLPAPP